MSLKKVIHLPNRLKNVMSIYKIHIFFFWQNSTTHLTLLFIKQQKFCNMDFAINSHLNSFLKHDACGECPNPCAPVPSYFLTRSLSIKFLRRLFENVRLFLPGPTRLDCRTAGTMDRWTAGPPSPSLGTNEHPISRMETLSVRIPKAHDDSYQILV